MVHMNFTKGQHKMLNTCTNIEHTTTTSVVHMNFASATTKKEKKRAHVNVHKKASYKYKYKVYIKMPLCSNEQNVSWFTNKKLN